MKRDETRRPMPIAAMDKTLPYSIENVWQALTDPTALAQWLLPTTFKLQLGRRFHFLHRTKTGKKQKVHCQVVEIEAPHRLAYTWRAEDEEAPSLVTWTLEPVEAGTCLHLEHIGLEISSGFENSIAMLSDYLDCSLQAGAPDTRDGRQPCRVFSSGAAVATGQKPIGRILLKPERQTRIGSSVIKRAARPGRPAHRKEAAPCSR